MAREKFETRKLTGNINVACKFEDGSVRYWSTTKEEVVAHIRAIVNEYAADGYILTLRQLHYQFVIQNWIVNHDSAYKKLGNILDDCRYGGVIDWNAIEDRGRVPYIPYAVEDVADALQDTVDQYRIDRQRGQSNYVELWTEKDALSGILKRSTEKYHVQLVVNKGYTSSSAIYGAYKRCVKQILEGKRVTILYFGDHDPSGLDMIRDIRERLTLFMSNGDSFGPSSDFWYQFVQPWWKENELNLYDLIDGGYASENIVKLMHEDDSDLAEEFDRGQIKMYLEEKKLFTVLPIGLTMAQIKKYKLPPNPTKLTDSRSDKYVKKFGKTCWEVDALRPQVLTEIVEANIINQIDAATFNEALHEEEMGVLELKQIIEGLN